ncbi:MAG: MFS transporter [Deltaproteobacteria bacterium]|nr:MAG: MFS transporter [Deltaproteobacteria bacterium]
MRKWTWIVVLFSRLILNLGVRVTYPFLPAIARGLGISFEHAGLLVAARHFMGLTAAFWGILSERKGYLRGMLLGLSALLVGALVVSVSRSFSLALIGFMLIGIAKPVYDPSVQAYASERVPYSKRARALGILESAWAGSWLLGIPLSGILIAHFGWQSPFVVIAGAALVAIMCTSQLPDVTRTIPDPSDTSNPTAVRPNGAASMEGKPFFILGVSFLMLFANENMVIVYGAWLEEQFHLQVQELGLFSMLVGMAELGGELTVVAVVDRIGKRRAILGGLTLTGLSYLILPFCRGSLFLAFAGLVWMFYLFEFTVVSVFPYVSELVPSERGKWLAFNFSALVVGRMAGALSGPWLWQKNSSLHTLATLSLLAQILAVFLLLWAGTNRQTPHA